MFLPIQSYRPREVAVPLPVLPHRPLSDRFGERLRTLRRSKQMTQTQLADYLGIDRSYISDVERGRKSISLVYLETVAMGFKISLSDLLDGL